VGIGEALVEARHHAGLTVTEVSQQTRIRETIIRAIEGDDYSGCGGDFYTRGHIRSIAKAVGADPEPFIHEYDEVHRAPGVLSAVSLDELVMPVQAPGRRRLNWTAVLGLALAVTAGFVVYSSLSGWPHGASARPAAANHAVTHAGPSRAPTAPTVIRPGHPATVAPRAQTGPVGTVRAYVAAINGHHYARAWRLGGRNTGGSYASFVSGFSTTARDTLTVVSVSDGVVTARLTARQTDGTILLYQGTYTVDNGVIVGADVVQVG
jgi:cytoskeletal protein RodZ